MKAAALGPGHFGPKHFGPGQLGQNHFYCGSSGGTAFSGNNFDFDTSIEVKNDYQGVPQTKVLPVSVTIKRVDGMFPSMFR